MERRRGFFHEDRIVALVLLAVAAGYLFSARALTSLRSDDAVGPAGFPILIAIAGLILGLCLLLRPTDDEGAGTLGGAMWLYWLVFVAYALALPMLGFGVSTVLFLAATFVILKVPALRAAVIALVVTAVFWLIFARLLGLRLGITPWI